jgi:hypothetical protein
MVFGTAPERKTGRRRRRSANEEANSYIWFMCACWALTLGVAIAAAWHENPFWIATGTFMTSTGLAYLWNTRS